MKIFDKRPLSFILCILLGAFVFFSFGDKTERIIIASIALILIFIAIFLKDLLKAQRLKLIGTSLLILFSCASSFLYFDVWYYAERRFPERCEIIGTVEETDFDDTYKSLVVNTDSINDKLISDYKIKVILDSDNDFTNITPGSQINFSAVLNKFEKTPTFDSASYYYAQGFSAEAKNVEDITVLQQNKVSISHKITNYRQSLARKLVNFSNEYGGGLLAALLLGEKEYLSGQLNLDFSRIGISHILALSGMHIAILCYGFSKILSLFGVNKKWRKLSEIIFAIAYMALTGFPISVVRAGLMVSISSALFLLSSSKDSVTNLFLSVAIICILEPFAVFDISLWLSAFATLGIIVFSEIIADNQNKLNKTLIDIISPFLSSIFAISATLAITYYAFGTISALSIFSTAIFSPIILVFMYLGTFFLFTASFIPLGNIIIHFSGFISWLANSFSSFKYSLLSTNHLVVGITVMLTTIALFLFLILDIRKRKTAVLLIIALFMSTILSAGVYTVKEKQKFAFEYYEEEYNERLLMKSNEEAALVEISNLNVTLAHKTLLYLRAKEITYLENYIITSYNAKTSDALNVLLSGIYIKNLYVPAPKSDTEKMYYNEILSVKEKFSSSFIPYENETPFEFSDFTLFPIYSGKSDSTAFTILYNDEFYTYLSANMLDAENKNYAIRIMNGANTVIIGPKGETSNTKDFIYKISGNTKLIYNKKAGPPDEILEYYGDRISVDPSGAVELYVE